MVRRMRRSARVCRNDIQFQSRYIILWPSNRIPLNFGGQNIRDRSIAEIARLCSAIFPFVLKEN